MCFFVFFFFHKYMFEQRQLSTICMNKANNAVNEYKHTFPRLNKIMRWVVNCACFKLFHYSDTCNLNNCYLDMNVQLPTFSTAILIIQMILKFLLFCSMPKNIWNKNGSEEHILAQTAVIPPFHNPNNHKLVKILISVIVVL